WAQPATGDQSAYEQSVVIAQAVRPYGDLHLAVMQLRATLGLHRDIGVVGAAVDEAVDASVGQGQEDVQLAAGLLRQQRPQAELEDLPGRAELIGRPRAGQVVLDGRVAEFSTN